MKSAAVFMVFVFKTVFGCHPTEQSAVRQHVDFSDYGNKNGSLRRKREAIPSAVSMEDFFVGCLSERMPFTRLHIPTVVKFTIDNTLWFESTNQNRCRSHGSDTIQCWQSSLDQYLDANSQLMNPAKTCVCDYAVYRDTGSKGPEIDPVFSKSYRKEAYQGQGLTLNEFRLRKHLRQRLRNSGYNVTTLVRLAKSELICSQETCDCADVQIPRGESCGQFWYTKLGAVTKLKSSIRKTIVNTMNVAIENAIREKRRNRRLQVRVSVEGFHTSYRGSTMRRLRWQ